MKKSEPIDHIWFKEQIAAYLAEGLGGAERGRFEAHRQECLSCAAEFESIAADDRLLKGLFEDAQPRAGLEDRILQNLRAQPQRRSLLRLPPLWRRAVATVAAILLLGFVGFAVDQVQRSTLVAVADNSPENHDFLFDQHPAKLFAKVQKREQPALDEFSLAQKTSPNEQAGKDVQFYRRQLSESLEDQLQEQRLGLRNGAEEVKKLAELSDAPKEQLSAETETLRREHRYRERDAQNAPVTKYSLNLQDGRAATGRFLSRGTNNEQATRGEALDESKPGESTVLFLDDAGRSDGTAMNGKDLKHYYSWHDSSVAQDSQDRFKPADFLKRLSAQSEAEKIEKELRLGRVFVEGKNESAGFGANQVPGDTKSDGAEPPKPGEPAGNPAPPPPPAPAPAPAPQAQRRIIRNGEMEFEVDSFDTAQLQVAKIVAEENGFIATTNSEKLPNGKVRGSVVLRVPPERLDTLILKLRALGELKNQRISSDDVTKKYTDLESELRAARAMEERLLNIIKTGTGQIKDLVAAEKELGNWREKIERIEGEVRYYNNLISLSTLTITLAEKDIKTPTYASETEQINVGLETEDVEKAYADALAAVTEHKGRVIESDMKKHEGGQFAAKIVCETAPDNAGALTDRLKQLGRVARHEVERKQSTQGGSGSPTGIKVERKATRFHISLYNLANIAPRETTSINLATASVEETYRAILARVEKAGGRVLNSSLNRPKPDQTSGTISFEIKSAEAETIQNDLRGAGEVMRLSQTENADTNNVTRAKRGFVVQIYALAQVAPRETTRMEIAAKNVPAAYEKILAAATSAKARVLASQLDEKDKQNVTGYLDIEVMRAELAAIDKALSNSLDVYSRNTSRAADLENTVDSKVRLQLTLVNADRLEPRETTTIGLEVADVDKIMSAVLGMAQNSGGRAIESHLSKDRSGRVSAKIVVDVPLSAAGDLISRVKEMGTVRVIEASRNQRVPEGALARARLDLTLGNAEQLVPNDQGVAQTIRRGLSTSATGLLWSLNLIIIGLCFVGPWALIVWAGYRYYRGRKA